MLKARDEAICVPILGRRSPAGLGGDYVFSIDGDVGEAPLKVPMVCRNNAEARSRAKDLLGQVSDLRAHRDQPRRRDRLHAGTGQAKRASPPGLRQRKPQTALSWRHRLRAILENGHVQRRGRGLAQDHVGGLFGDHDRAGIGVAADEGRKDRGVDDAQATEALNL